MRAVQTMKGAAPATFAVRNARAAALGLSPREYLSLGRFANAAEKLGIQSTGIGKGPFGRGCLLKMKSPSHDYEVLVNRTGFMLLGQVTGGKRTRLFEAGTLHTQLAWDRLFAALKNNETRAQV